MAVEAVDIDYGLVVLAWQDSAVADSWTWGIAVSPGGIGIEVSMENLDHSAESEESKVADAAFGTGAFDHDHCNCSEPFVHLTQCHTEELHVLLELHCSDEGQLVWTIESSFVFVAPDLVSYGTKLDLERNHLGLGEYFDFLLDGMIRPHRLGHMEVAPKSRLSPS